MKIKAIETKYNGYRFRSRMEARWAIFFDALKIDYDYEKEGYNFDGEMYLPDFWLSTVMMWGEVKPGYPTQHEKYLMLCLAKETGYPALMLSGTPENRPYTAIMPDGSEYEYCLTNYHNYPQTEHRFYASPGGFDDSHWNDTLLACAIAKGARFEHSETMDVNAVRGAACMQWHEIEMGVV